MNANPYESPEAPLLTNPSDAPNSPRWIAFLFKSLFVFALLLLIGFLALPVFSRGRHTPAYRPACINNVRQVQLAILNYESVHGHFPPAYTVDADGNRLHSWRTLILPYIEEGALYNTIDLTKPWDDPANAKAREAYVTPYICPRATHDESKTTYMALTGPEHIMSGSVEREFNEFPEPSEWAMIIEVPSNRAVHWMSPYDADEEFLTKLTEDDNFQHEVFIVGFMDNHTLSVSISELNAFRENLPRLSEEVQSSL